MLGLDRETFNNIVKDAASKKREYYESFLNKVELLHDMDPYERLQIADALKSQKFKKGDYIIKQVKTNIYSREKMEPLSICSKRDNALQLKRSEERQIQFTNTNQGITSENWHF